MNPDTLKTLHSLRQVVGLVLLIGWPAISYLRWNDAAGAINVMETAPKPVTKTDSAFYSSAVYHGSYAMAVRDNRWRPTGYATQGIGGFSLGLVLLLLPLMQRGKGSMTTTEREQ